MKIQKNIQIFNMKYLKFLFTKYMKYFIAKIPYEKKCKVDLMGDLLIFQSL